MKKGSIEISVQQASSALNVTTRTILNYIKAQEIQAIKVGKKWFIKEPSFRAFAQRYQLAIDELYLDGPGEISSLPEDFEEVSLDKEAPDLAIKKSKYIIDTLKLYQIAHKAFFCEKWEKVDSESGPMKRILELRLTAMELIGSGYYSFNKAEKRDLYNSSRKKVGAILSLFYTDKDLQKEWGNEISFIEKELMGAYSSLIRKMEKKSEGK